MKKIFLILIALALQLSSFAQTPSFATVASAVSLGGGLFDLTTSTGGQRGAIWCTSGTLIDFTRAFSIEFDMKFTTNANPADGVCLVFGQNISSSSINGNAAFWGYYDNSFIGTNPDFQNSLAVEFDIFLNPAPTPGSMDFHDVGIAVPHTAIVSNADPTPILLTGAGPVPGPTVDNNFHHYKVDWCPESLTMDLYIDDILILSTPVNIPAIFTSSLNIPWGFTAGTGQQASTQSVKNISLVRCNYNTKNINKNVQIFGGGDFAYGAINVGSNLPSGGDPIVAIDPTVSTRFIATPTTVTPNFLATVNTGNFFEILPGCKCNSPCGPITVTPIGLGEGTCIGSRIQLTASGWGTWSSGNTLVATVNPATGLVTALSTGTALMTYTWGECILTTLINVGNCCRLPDIYSGFDEEICIGEVINFTNSIPGGVWSTSVPFWSHINPATGVFVALSPGSYTITYTIGSCSTSTSITISECQGEQKIAPKTDDNKNGKVQQISRSFNISVHPNPAQNTITITYPCKSAGQLEISIKDVAGRVRKAESVRCDEGTGIEHQVDISAFSPGVYTVDLTLNDQHVVKKIVKL